MKTIASHTLGCKVNQYDTQAMLELFQADGYQVVPMDQPADVYLVNTCTVTGTGDRKSLQLIRKIRREHPSAVLIVCGCMAQERGEDLLSTGADLVIGTQRRGEILSLLDQVLETGKPLCAVEPLREGQPFERLSITRQNDHCRAVLKIQEVDTFKPDYLFATLGDSSRAKIAWEDMEKPTKASRISLTNQLARLSKAVKTNLAAGTKLWNATDWGTPGRIYANDPTKAE